MQQIIRIKENFQILVLSELYNQITINVQKIIFHQFL
jgi:hypothetical protein